MGRPSIQSFSPTPNIDVYECHRDSERPYNHWRLWDKRREYNIVMDARTKEDALVEAIEYWAERCMEIESEHNDLKRKVERFVDAVYPETEEED